MLNGRGIALATQLDDGTCRLCLHLDLVDHMRFEFTSSLASGVRYLERWVRAWEAELRQLYARPRPVGRW